MRDPKPHAPQSGISLHELRFASVQTDPKSPICSPTFAPGDVGLLRKVAGSVATAMVGKRKAEGFFHPRLFWRSGNATETRQVLLCYYHPRHHASPVERRCRRWDSNPYGLSPRDLAGLRVYHFRHAGTLVGSEPWQAQRLRRGITKSPSEPRDNGTTGGSEARNQIVLGSRRTTRTALAAARCMLREPVRHAPQSGISLHELRFASGQTDPKSPSCSPTFAPGDTGLLRTSFVQ